MAHRAARVYNHSYVMQSALDEPKTKKGESCGILPFCECATETRQDWDYWPDEELVLAVAVPPAFGMLKYPVAVVLVTLLITSSSAARLPPV